MPDLTKVVQVGYSPDYPMKGYVHPTPRVPFVGSKITSMGKLKRWLKGEMTSKAFKEFKTGVMLSEFGAMTRKDRLGKHDLIMQDQLQWDPEGFTLDILEVSTGRRVTSMSLKYDFWINRIILVTCDSDPWNSAKRAKPLFPLPITP